MIDDSGGRAVQLKIIWFVVEAGGETFNVMRRWDPSLTARKR